MTTLEFVQSGSNVKPDHATVAVLPGAPLAGLTVAEGGVCARAGVIVSTVTPATVATSTAKDRIPSPRIRT
ncbi:hypothetical protein Lesp02_83020 [Lentzea sp. NBRC 105346]|nr:hypothetical protein Lesp02_83020 [Lentzea sp. NBRC 105346]